MTIPNEYHNSTNSAYWSPIFLWGGNSKTILKMPAVSFLDLAAVICPCFPLRAKEEIMKKLCMSLSLLMLFIFTATACFARPDTAQDMFGTWEVSGRLVIYKTGTNKVLHEYPIQPFVLEVGDKSLEQAYADFSPEEKDLAFQALKNFMTVNYGLNKFDDRDFNQIVQQLNKTLYLPFDKDAERIGNEYFQEQYIIPIEGSYYTDRFTLQWKSSSYLFFHFFASWHEKNSVWSPDIYYGKFIIANDRNSVQVRGDLDTWVVGECKDKLTFDIELNMVRCDG